MGEEHLGRHIGLNGAQHRETETPLQSRMRQAGNIAGYSGSVSPDPPISLGISFILGSPSLMWRTVSW